MQLPPSANVAALPPEVLPAHVANRVAALAGGEQPLAAYLYDVDVAARRAATLRAALPRWCEVFYAVKANAFPPVLQALSAGGVDGFEVASARETRTAVAAVAATGREARLVAAGPGKSESLLAALVDGGVEVVNVESVMELHRLAAVTARTGRRVRVALRVNPRRVPVTGSLVLGGAPTQFGIPEDRLGEAVAVARRLPGIEVVGFHVHAICQNLDATAHAGYVAWCLEWAAGLADDHRVDLRVLDVGGGLGVDFSATGPFDLAVFAAALARLSPPGGLRVLLEPGRWLVADSGWYAAEVLDVKVVHGTWFAVLRGGINHFQLPTSWDVVHNFTVVEVPGWRYRCPRPEVADAAVTVVGELCTTEDTLARDVTVPRLRVGDVVVFPMAGSYGWEFAMHHFLGHPPAARLVVTAVTAAAAAALAS